MRFFLTDQDIEVFPREGLTIGLNSDFTGDPAELEVDVDRLILPREALDIVQNHINTIGFQEGLPVRIETSNGLSVNYYIDFFADPKFRDFEVEVTIKRRKGKDAFFDLANGTSFETMAAEGVNFDTFDLPYVIIKDDAAAQALTLGVTLYIMTKELIDQIITISTSITQIIDAVTPSTGTGVTFNIGQIITMVVKVILQIAIAALLLLAIIELAQQFFELIYPKVRKFQASKIKRLLEQACEHLGYTFESSLLDNLPGLTLQPVPLLKDKDSFWSEILDTLDDYETTGYPTASDTTPTPADLLNALEDTYNGRTKVVDGVVQFEIRNFWQSTTQNSLQPALNLQEKRQSEYTLNTNEAWRRTIINYQVDQSDLHTLDFFDPTNAEYSTVPINIVNADLVNLKGLNKVNIPFALGVRKNELNWLEELGKKFFEVLDEILNALGGNGNFTGQITNRIGVMQISQQYFMVTKLMYTVAGKQPANYTDIMKASAIYNNYHTINEIQQNDFKIISDAPVAVSPNDFVNLLNNNYAEIDGVVSEILTIRYIDEESKAVVSYKEPFDYANGKVQTIAINT